MKFFFYRVIVCVCVCNLHVNCVSFVRVVVVVLLKLIDFQEERKLDIFSRKHNFRKQQQRDKKIEEKQESRDKSSSQKKTHHIFFIMAPSTSSSNNNASFTKIFEQIHHKDRGKCATLRAGFCFLFIFLSLDRGGPRKSSTTHFLDEITSLTDKLFFSLSLCLLI